MERSRTAPPIPASNRTGCHSTGIDREHSEKIPHSALHRNPGRSPGRVGEIARHPLRGHVRAGGTRDARARETDRGLRQKHERRECLRERRDGRPRHGPLLRNGDGLRQGAPHPRRAQRSGLGSQSRHRARHGVLSRTARQMAHGRTVRDHLRARQFRESLFGDVPPASRTVP